LKTKNFPPLLSNNFENLSKKLGEKVAKLAEKVAIYFHYFSNMKVSAWFRH